MPETSAIICVYNQPLVRDAIESVLSQTYPDFELIIIDDGSDWETQKVLKNYSDRTKIYRQKNSGIASARNRGISLADGQFIAFLDSDDIWLPHYLEKQIKFLKQNPEFTLSFSDGWFLRQTQIPPNLLNLKTYYSIYTPPSGENSLEKFFKTPIITSLIVFRRNFFEKVGFFSEELQVHEDADLLLKALESEMKFGFLQQPLGIKRQLSSGLSQDDLRVYLFARKFHINSWNRTKKIRPFLRDGMPKLNSAIAKIYFEKGDRRTSRKFLMEALKFKPYSIRTLASLLVSFLPESLSTSLLIKLLPTYKKWK